MGDGGSIPDREQHVIAAAYHLVKALEATTNLSNDMRKLLADLDMHLSTMASLNQGEADKTREIESRLLSAQQTITNLHSHHSWIWVSGPVTLSEYLQAVDEVRRLIQTLEDRPLKKCRKREKLLDQAQTLLQIAMSRLQEELIHILSQNKLCFELDYTAVPTRADSLIIYEESSVFSNEDDSVENASPMDNACMECLEYAVDLVHPDVIPQLKSIAEIMLVSCYQQEFLQAFTGFWRCALAEYLTILDIEPLSIEDVLQMEWESLNVQIRNWRNAIKSVICIYLASAKRLFDQVLGGYGCISSICLVEASKPSVMCLLNFGQAVAIGPHRPEWLYCLLNMYEVLAALIPDVDALFPQEIGSWIHVEYDELLMRLTDSVRLIVGGVGNYISSCCSSNPYLKGGIHPLTKYVMNYILCFGEYGDTLNCLLQSPEMVISDRGQNAETEKSGFHSPVASHLQSWTAILEANLNDKSNLYTETTMKNIFMMNNVHYMVTKIKNSKISIYFGDEWIKNHIAKFRQHAMRYERVTWSSILLLLRDDGKKCKAIQKARCRAFTTAFEDVYKNQTKWYVPDLQLREDLRISAAKIIIPAYRNFFCKIANSIGEKYIKYSEQDLETYILDLLEGSSKSLNHSKRR